MLLSDSDDDVILLEPQKPQPAARRSKRSSGGSSISSGAVFFNGNSSAIEDMCVVTCQNMTYLCLVAHKGSCRIYQADTGVLDREHNDHSSTISSVAALPRGVVFTGGHDGVAHSYRLSDGERLESYHVSKRQPIHKLVVTSEHMIVGLRSGAIQVFLLGVSQPVKLLQGHSKPITGLQVSA